MALQVFEHLVGVSFGFHIVEDVLDLSLGTDHECGARDPLHNFAVHVFVLDYAESAADLFVRIGKQSVWQVVLVLKFLLLLGTIGRDAQHGRSRFLNLIVCVAEPARFFRSTRGVGLGKEKEHDRFAAKVFQ
jgi:hypothetical protein